VSRVIGLIPMGDSIDTLGGWLAARSCGPLQCDERVAGQ